MLFKDAPYFFKDILEVDGLPRPIFAFLYLGPIQLHSSELPVTKIPFLESPVFDNYMGITGR
jgi:hypothetical protein